MALRPQKLPPLRDADPVTQVCIIGGGITGLSVAYALLRAGRSVVVLEQETLGSGETSHTTGHLTCMLDKRPSELEKTFGAKATRMIMLSHMAAIDEIESIIGHEKISCGFERLNAYLYAPDQDSAEEVSEEYEVLTRLDIAADFLHKAPFSSFVSGPAICLHRQAHFQMGPYLKGLALAVTRMGGKILTCTGAAKIQPGKPARVLTDQDFSVSADAVVMAIQPENHAGFFDKATQDIYRSYVMAFKIPRGYFSKGLYWDTERPYHYLRLNHPMAPTKADPCSVLTVGGEDHLIHKQASDEEHFSKLEGWTRKYFPKASEIISRWHGNIAYPKDGVARIGLSPKHEKNIFVVSGDSGNGITNAMIAGRLLTDLIMDRPNPWSSLYDPARASQFREAK